MYNITVKNKYTYIIRDKRRNEMNKIHSGISTSPNTNIFAVGDL